MFSLHYRPKKVSEINVKADSRVSTLGKVTELGEKSFFLDDGSGKIEIISEAAVEPNKLVRAFCSVVDSQLKADVVQSLNNFDLDLFNRIKELYSRAGV
jgi:hypothetical protein